MLNIMKTSKLLVYLTDLSYWVYLSNMPIVAVIQIRFKAVEIHNPKVFVKSAKQKVILSVLISSV